MTRRTWCTLEQRTWFDDLLAAFVKAKETKGTTDFIADTCTKYAAKWPLDPPTEKELADAGDEKKAAERKIYESLECLAQLVSTQRIKNWFNNHTRAWAPGVGSCKVLNLRAARKLMQPWQAYQSLYWENELKEKVNAAWITYTAGLQEGMKLDMTKFQLRNAKIQQWYAEVSPDVKLKVEEHRQNMKAKGLLGNSENRGFQRAIDKLLRTLQTAAEALARQTGWHVSIIVGGPTPRLTGQLRTLAVHHGATQGGLNFEQYLDHDYTSRIITSFDDFLLESFDEEKRLARAIETQDDLSEESDQDGEPEPTPESSNKKSDYELTREANIIRNKELLAELGLLEDSNLTKEGGEGKSTKTRTRKKKDKSNMSAEPRRSGRGKKTDRTTDISSSSNLAVNDSVAMNDNPTLSKGSAQHQTGPDNPPSITVTTTTQRHEQGLREQADTTLASLRPDFPNPSSPSARFPSVEDVTGQGSGNGETVVDKGTSGNTLIDVVDKAKVPAVDIAAAVATTVVDSDTAAAVATTVVDMDVAMEDMEEGLRASAPWFRVWLKFFQGVSRDERWLGLIARWIRYEYLEPDEGRVPATLRPEEIDWWIKRGRPMDNFLKQETRPNLVRRGEAGGKGESLLKEVPSEADWTQIIQGGPLGLALVVMTLAWWITATKDDEGLFTGTNLSAAITDVGWVLEKLAVAILESRKENLKRPSSVLSMSVTSAKPKSRQKTIK
ncbi:hypothetical protein JOM56_013021 [Amanita muscaria]